MSENISSSCKVSTDDNFKNRANSIFGSLDSLEKKHQENVIHFDENNDDGNDRKNNSMKDSESCGSNDISHRPNRNLQHNKRRFPSRVPDHVLNPSNYRKYRYISLDLMLKNC